MVNSNWKFGIALVILSILTYLANYLDMLAVPAIVVNIGLSVFIGCVAMVQTLRYNDSDELSIYNPATFWLIYSSVNGVILVCVISALYKHLIDEQLSLALLYGISPMLIPSMGVLLGDHGRIIVGKKSVI
jgi:CDP-diglyceride synthetase